VLVLTASLAGTSTASGGEEHAAAPAPTPAAHEILAGWVQQSSNTGSNLNGLALFNESTALAVGMVGGGGSPVIRRTSNFGTNWNTVTNNGSTMLNAAQFVDNDTWVFAAAAGVFGRTDNAGANWKWVTVGNPNDFFLDVHFEDSARGWLVGVLEGGPGPRTPMARTVDGGNTWTKPFPGATYQLRGIEFLSSTVAVAAGNNGTAVLIMRSTDAGITWTQVPFPPPSNPAPITSVDFVGPAVGYVGSTAGRYWRSDDGGLTWSPGVVDSSGGTGDLSGLSFVDPDHGWASTTTGRIYATRDGGASWTRQNVPNNPGQFFDIRFWDLDYGYACGSGGDIHFTDDGGGVPGDNQAPNVTLITPSNNSVVNGTVSVSANASDNVGVTKVRFMVDATDIGNDTSAPYSVQWDTLNSSNGNHVVKAIAYDQAGNTASDQANVVVANIVDNEPPKVSIVSPAQGAVVNGTASILSNASDNVAVRNVELFAGGASLGKDNAAPYQWPWDTTAVPDGRYALLAIATDTSGNVNSSTVDVYVKNTPDAPPQVSIMSPANGAAVSKVVRVTADAKDDLAVMKVEFLVDGAHAWDDNSAPYEALVDSYLLQDGPHKLKAVAWDVANQAASHEISVTVANGGGADTQKPVVSISTPESGAEVRGTVKVRGVAADNVGVVQVELFANGVLINGTKAPGPYEFGWDTTGMTGSVDLKLEASDAAGNKGSDTVTVSIATDEKPTVSILSPAAGTTVAKTVTISVAAADDLQVKEVKVFVDGTEIKAFSAPPYAVQWDTTQYSHGDHLIKATASDGVSTSESAEVKVTVANAGLGLTSGGEAVPWLPWLLVMLLLALLIAVALRKRKPAPEAPPAATGGELPAVRVAQPATEPPKVEDVAKPEEKPDAKEETAPPPKEDAK
jgi:photosystem II stability/assembly factor-like uncharacterized protein